MATGSLERGRKQKQKQKPTSADLEQKQVWKLNTKIRKMREIRERKWKRRKRKGERQKLGSSCWCLLSNRYLCSIVQRREIWKWELNLNPDSTQYKILKTIV